MSDFEFDVSDIDIPDVDMDTDIPDLSDVSAEGIEEITEAVDTPDDDFYHAERMSDAEVARIDDLWDESKDVSDVEPYKAISSGEISDVDDVALTDEEKFAAEIESMSLDDLQAERDRLEELSKMSDMDIFADYDEQAGGNRLEQFDTAIEGMSTEQLADLRESLEARNPEVLEFFGIEDEGADDRPSLKLKRTL